MMEYYSAIKRKELYIVDTATVDGSQTPDTESKQPDAELCIPSDPIPHKPL